MRVEYTLTSEDVVAFNIYHFRQSPTGRRQRLIAWLAPPIVWAVGWCVFVGLSLQPLTDAKAFWPLLLIVPVYLAVFPWWQRRRLSAFVAHMLKEGQDKNIIGNRQLWIDPEVITEVTESKNTTRKWEVVEKIVVTEGYAFFYLTIARATIIIPKLAFSYEWEFNQFVELAQRYHLSQQLPP